MTAFKLKHTQKAKKKPSTRSFDQEKTENASSKHTLSPRKIMKIERVAVNARAAAFCISPGGILWSRTGRQLAAIAVQRLASISAQLKERLSKGSSDWRRSAESIVQPVIRLGVDQIET